MRKRFIRFLLFLVLAFNVNISLAQTEDSFGDTTSLENELSTDSTTNEEVEEDENEVETEDEVVLIDTTYFRTIDSSQWQIYKNDKAFTYKIEKQKPIKRPNLSFLKWIFKILSFGVLKFILYALVAIAIFYILYTIIIQSEFNYFIRRKNTSKAETASWENVADFTDWDIALQKALDIPDYRLATRIMYLETLQTLHLAQLIKYEQEKTNWEYVTELGDTTFKKPFTLFTKYFDYVWYGNFVMTNENFEEIKNIYTLIKQSAKFQ